MFAKKGKITTAKWLSNSKRSRTKAYAKRYCVRPSFSFTTTNANIWTRKWRSAQFTSTKTKSKSRKNTLYKCWTSITTYISTIPGCTGCTSCPNLQQLNSTYAIQAFYNYTLRMVTPSISKVLWKVSSLTPSRRQQLTWKSKSKSFVYLTLQ